MRILVIGDIHGGFKSLIQCLERSKFDYDNDLLISLGDLVDGWPESKQVIDFMLSIPNLIQIIGNHDKWFLDFCHTGYKEPFWVTQGGQATIDSYIDESGRLTIPESHVKFLEKANLLYLDDKNRLFVHGGVDPNQVKLEKQNPDTCMWDRRLIIHAMQNKGRHKTYGPWKEIYIGHTTIFFRGYEIPTKFCNVWALDTGGGWEGKLSIMDIETKEFWQSDQVSSLYPDHEMRSHKK